MQNGVLSDYGKIVKSKGNIKEIKTMDKKELVNSILKDMEYKEDIRDGIWTHKSDTYQELFREAHGDMLPDDFRYEMIHGVLCAMADADDIDDIDVLEACDELVPIYNSELLQWVSSHLSRAGYIEEAIEEFGEPQPFDFFKSLQYGYLFELEEVFGLVDRWLDRFLDEVEEEDVYDDYHDHLGDTRDNY